MYMIYIIRIEYFSIQIELIVLNFNSLSNKLIHVFAFIDIDLKQCSSQAVLALRYSALCYCSDHSGIQSKISAIVFQFWKFPVFSCKILIT